MDLRQINTLWRPFYGMLQKGVNLLIPEWERLGRLQGHRQLSMRSINWPVELTHGGGVVFTEDGGSVARASSNEPVEATDTWRHIAKRFEVSYDVITLENDSKVSDQQIEKQLRYQAADALRSIKRMVSIHFYGFPDAVLFEAGGAGSGATALPVENLYGQDGVEPRFIRDYITAGKDRVAIVDPSDGTISHSSLVTAINETTGVLTLEDSGTWDATDVVVLYNHAIEGEGTDFGRGINGLLHLTRGQIVHNIDRDEHPDWAAAVDISDYDAVLNGKDMFRWFQDIEQRSDHAPQWMYTTTDIIAEGGGSQLDQRRYDASDNSMKLGFDRLVAMGVTLEGRPYTPAGHLFIGSNTALRKIAPDDKPKDVVTSGDRSQGGHSFKQYENRLGFYNDMAFRINPTVVSRLGLGVVSEVKDTPPE